MGFQMYHCCSRNLVFTPHFIKIEVEGNASGSLYVIYIYISYVLLKHVFWCAQGHAPCKTLSLQQVNLLCQLNCMEIIKDCHKVEVSLATLGFGDNA